MVIQNKKNKKSYCDSSYVGFIFLIFLTVARERKYSRRERDNTRTTLWEIFETMSKIQKKNYT